MNIYEKNGYENRQDYIQSLSEDYGIEQETVQYLADILGHTEDFDGLISSLEDYEYGFEF